MSAEPVRQGPEVVLDDHYDLVVIGGGINGAGIVRDAALRGLRVLLLEKGDFCSGTTSWSSRLIHGGLRYLEYGELPLVFESLHERRRLRAAAPHLVKPLRLSIPIYAGGLRGRWIIKLGMVAYDVLSVGKKMPRHRMFDREEMLASEPGLNDAGLLGGAQYYDAQITFVERLVIENLVDAVAAGAHVRNYSPVIGINVRDRRIDSVQFIDASGSEREVRTDFVINAAGPWVDRVLATVNRAMPGQMGGTKGSHIVTRPFLGAPQSAVYVEAKSDGRPFFIIPWNEQFLIGTTDIRYKADPGDVRPDEAEIRYLLDETNRVFPQAALTEEDIRYAYAGVRPLPRRDKGPESAITRKHILKRHRVIARGFISVIGGKITTYRNLAEQAVDRVARGVDRSLQSCVTRDRPLPGGQPLDALSVSPLAAEAVQERLRTIYGSSANDILALAGEPATSGYVDAGQTMLKAEVAWAIRQEFAANLVDIVHRRTMVGLNGDQGRDLAAGIAAAAAAEFGWSEHEVGQQLAALDNYNRQLRSWLPPGEGPD